MKSWHVILTILLTSAICFFFGYNSGSKSNDIFNESDTIRIRDTIRDSIPYPVIETVVQVVPELFPVYITLEGDTIHEPVYIPVTITQKEYTTDNYRAWVSGYKPSIDSVWVYPEKIYIKGKTRRFGIGLIAGYGVGKNGLSPYVGVGGFYRIW